MTVPANPRDTTRAADAFNERFPVGAPVLATAPDGSEASGEIRSAAAIMGGAAMVRVRTGARATSGFYPINSIRPAA